MSELITNRFGAMALGLLLGAPAIAALPESGVSISTSQYAKESSPTPRVELNAAWDTGPVTKGYSLPGKELRFYSFFEGGRGGDKTFDVNTAVMRFAVSQNSHFWVGRSHPAIEDAGNGSRLQLRPTSAVGANWVQNQSSALEPWVSGWVGGGWSGRVLGVNLTVGMSPLFLPTFGPRLDLSETEDARGSRFAKLPPAYLRNSAGQLIPIRYKVNAGDIKDIVLQNQAFVSIGVDDFFGHVRLFGWTAPSPDPEVETSGLIQVDPDSLSTDVNALVTARPKFARQTFIGIDWALPARRPVTIFEAVYEQNSGRLTVSAEARPWRFVQVGYLHTFDPADNISTSAPGSVVPSPKYAKDLVWGEVAMPFLKNRLRPSFRAEHHLTPGRQDLWLHPMVQYQFSNPFVVYGSVSLLVGEDRSYFGQWRSLDSMSMGVRYLW